MTSIELGYWDIAYNDTKDEIRLFVNGYDKDAIFIALSKDNLESFLESLESSPIVSTQGQFLIPQIYSEPLDEEDEIGAPNYSFDDSNLEQFYRGDIEDIELFFSDEKDAHLVASSIWSFWATDHILLEA